MSHFDTFLRHFRAITLASALILIYPSAQSNNSPLPDPDFIISCEPQAPNKVSEASPEVILEVDTVVTFEEIIATLPEQEKAQAKNLLHRSWIQFKEKYGSYSKVLALMRDQAPKKIRQLLTRFKAHPEIQEAIIGDVEKKLKEGPELIIKANATGFGIRLNAILGLGIGDFIVKKLGETQWGKKLKLLRKTKLGRWVLPPGFLGVGLGAGVGFLSFENAGKKYLLVRLFGNGEYTEKVVNVMIDAFAGITTEFKLTDIIDVQDTLRKRVFVDQVSVQRMNLGPAGSMVADHQSGHFSHDVGLGFSGVLGLGQLSFYIMRMHQLRLNIVFNMDWVRKVKLLFRQSCRSALSK